MYKLIYNGLSKSKASLTSFTSPCKKFSQRSDHNRSPDATKTYMSESDLLHRERTIEYSDQTNEICDTVSETDINVVRYNQFLIKGLRAAGLKRPLFESKSNTQSVRTITYSSSPSKYFYSSLVDDNKNSAKKKTFKNREAIEMYKNAVAQCNRIKNDRYKVASIYRSANWFPKPVKPGFSWEATESTQPTENPEIVVAEEPEQPPKQFPTPKAKRVVHVFQERRHISKHMTKDIANISIRKPNNQFKKGKFRITYPTHSVKYKIGLNRPHYIEQQESILKNNLTYEEITKIQNNSKGVAPTDILQAQYKSQPNLAILMKLKTSVETKDPHMEHKEKPIVEEVEEEIVKQHPTVEKVSKRARMSIANKYNQLLSKIFSKKKVKNIVPVQETIVEGRILVRHGSEACRQNVT